MMSAAANGGDGQGVRPCIEAGCNVSPSCGSRDVLSVPRLQRRQFDQDVVEHLDLVVEGRVELARQLAGTPRAAPAVHGTAGLTGGRLWPGSVLPRPPPVDHLGAQEPVG
jgi:hypothetical protein